MNRKLVFNNLLNVKVWVLTALHVCPIVCKWDLAPQSSGVRLLSRHWMKRKHYAIRSPWQPSKEQPAVAMKKVSFLFALSWVSTKVQLANRWGCYLGLLCVCFVYKLQLLIRNIVKLFKNQNIKHWWLFARCLRVVEIQFDSEVKVC